MSDERPPPSHGGRRRAPRRGAGSPRSITSKSVLLPVVGLLAAIAMVLVLLTTCQGGFDATNAPTTPSPTLSTPQVTQPVVVPVTTPPTHSTTPTPTASHTTKPTTTPTPTATPTPSSTAVALTVVNIYNGTTKVGLAASWAKKLKPKGWTIRTVSNWASQTIKTTVVYYPPGQKASAQKLATDVGNARVAPATSSAMSSTALTLVLGTSAA